MIKHSMFKIEAFFFITPTLHTPLYASFWYFAHIRKILAWPHHFTKRRLGPIKLVKAHHCYWSAYTNPGKWVVMYMCVRGHVYVC